MTIKITGPKSISLPESLGGDGDIYPLFLLWASRGVVVTPLASNQVQIGGIEDLDLLPISVVRTLVSKSCEVYGYPCYFKIDNIAAACPFSDSGETWETWGVYGQSHLPMQIGDYWYRSSAVGQSGDNLPASLWAAVEGLEVISVEEYLALA